MLMVYTALELILTIRMMVKFLKMVYTGIVRNCCTTKYE